MIDIVLQLADKVKHPNSKVDLSNGKYVIFVDVIKVTYIGIFYLQDVACVSVIEDYILLKKCNVNEVVKGLKVQQIKPKQENETDNTEIIKKSDGLEKLVTENLLY